MTGHLTQAEKRVDELRTTVSLLCDQIERLTMRILGDTAEVDTVVVDHPGGLETNGGLVELASTIELCTAKLEATQDQIALLERKL